MLSDYIVKKTNGKHWCQRQLADEKLPRLLEKVDYELAEKASQEGCLYCGSKLHRGNYKRKPRGGPEHWDKRCSFCCSLEGCRRRLTPPSVRFFGRRFFIAPIVVLLSAMNHGLTAERVRRLREWLDVDVRTLERWRLWWLETFVQSPFWKAARAQLMPPVDQATLPWSLGQRFGFSRRQRLVAFLKFLSPLTTRSAREGRAM